jgi:hypothetical protein
MSGRQMATSAYRAMDHLADEYAASLEVNLVAASPDHLEQGLQAFAGEDFHEIKLPIKSYYRARTVIDNSHGGVPTNTAAITGTHASGDYGVEFVIAELVKAKAKRGEPIPMPPLTNIIREYRGEEQLEWTTEEYHGDRPDIDDYLEDEL